MTPLHTVGEGFRQLMIAIPLPVVRAAFVLLFVVLFIWVLCLPKDRTTPMGEGRRPSHWKENLKNWAALALALQAAIYLLW